MLRSASSCLALGFIFVNHFPAIGQSHSPQVSGRVVDESANAIADASVSLVAIVGDGLQVQTVSTDANGEYRCQIPKKAEQVTVAAFKENFALGQASHVEYGFQGREPLTSSVKLNLTLAPAKPLTLQILDEQGTPTRATLHLMSISKPGGSADFYWGKAHENGVKALARTTDSEGFVTLEYQPATGILGLLVETERLGVQAIMVDHQRVADTAKVRLNPVSRINVSLLGLDGSAKANRTVSVHSTATQAAIQLQPQGATIQQSSFSPAFSSMAAPTDANGRVSMTVIAGQARISVSAKPGDKSFAVPSEPITLEAGETRNHVINFEPGVRYFGRVVDPDGNPVGGVKISAMSGEVTSDELGNYEFWAPSSQQVWLRVQETPPGYVIPSDDRPVKQDDGDAKQDFELRDIRVERGVEIAGIVVDEAGNPVPSAKVVAAWVQTNPMYQTFTRRTDTAQTNSDGEFKLDSVLANVDVRITAETNDVATPAQTIHADTNQQLELIATPSGVARLSGTVRASDGSVVKHPVITVSRAMLTTDQNDWGSRPVKWDGTETLTGDEQGHFITPSELPRSGKYSLSVSATGYLSATVPYQSPSAEGALDFGVLELTKARSAKGMIVDSAGQPISGAIVNAWSADRVAPHAGLKRATVTSDDGGQFSLVKLHPHSASVLVEKGGYRISGAGLLDEQPEVRITLYRDDEPVPDADRIKPTSDDVARHGAAKVLLAKIMPERRDSSYFHSQLVDMLWRVDPGALLGEVEQTKRPQTRARILARLGETDDALAEIEEEESAYRRGFSRFQVLDHVNDPDLARDILANALIDADAIRRPDQRLVVVAEAANRFFKLGDKQTAEQILRDELEQAGALATKEWAGYARASYAERLALFELDTALKMVGDMEPDDQPRHFQNIAHLIAATNPAGAEAALKNIKGNRYIDSPVVRAAYRMATTDLPRALSLLELIDESRHNVGKARTLGVISYAIKDDNLIKARELLGRAFEALPPLDQGRGYRAEAIFGASMTLLRYAEEVDPQRLTDYFWLTVSKYGGPAGNAWSPDEMAEADADRQARLAILMARYGHPKLAKQLAEAAFTYWETQIGQNADRFDDREASFMAMALADPKRAVDWAIRFNEKLDKELRRRIPQPWEVIGNALTHNRSELGKMITKELFHHWTIDRYDL